MANRKRETTDYVILEISKIGRSEPENLKAIDKIIEQICEEFTGRLQTVGLSTAPVYSYQYPVTETLREGEKI